MIRNHISMLSVIYRSPSQTNNKFELLLSNFEKFLNNLNKRKPFLCGITGDFNGRFSSWWDIETNTTETSKLYSFTSSNGFSQLINEPTHKQTNRSSGIDSIFTEQSNLSLNTESIDFYTQIVIIKMCTLVSTLIFATLYHINAKYWITKRLIQLT